MKTQNQDKATAVDSALALVDKIHQFRDAEKMIKSERELYAILRGRVKSEHAALEAVAEAAEWLYSAERAEREALKISSASRCQHQIANRKDAHAKYLTCRANLAAVREGGAK